MMENQKTADNTTESPFQDKINLGNFYSGAGRGELLERMRGAVESGVPLVVISGGEGSGKTMLCRMLESDCPASLVVTFFTSTVESFEDVVRIVAQRLGLLLSSSEGKSIGAAIEQITAHLLRQSVGLLVIFDDAEDIYLATLERIRKMLDRITAAGARMQIVFSGRKAFLENCAQLSICDFRNTENLHFELLPLTEQETSDYLHYCLERLDHPDKKKVCSDEAVDNIHALAKGKFRRINLLADGLLRSPSKDTSVAVLFDSVKDDEVDADKDEQEPVLPTIRRAIPYMYWIGGALCTLILLFFLLQPGEKRRAIKPASLPSLKDTQKIEVVAQSGGGQKSAAQSVKETISQPLTQQQENSQKQLEGVEQTTLKESEAVSSTIVPLAVIEAKSQEVAVQPTAAVLSASKHELEPLPAPTQTKVAKGAETKVLELRQIPFLKSKPVNLPDPAIGTAKLQPRTDSPEIVGTLTVDQLYQKRLNAGTIWASGERNDKFTVQLMALTAKDAELNLKKMLAQPSYRQEAGNFFIFKKNGSPEVVLVFYGEYPTIDLARLAQISLPQFLQGHQPYAISVKGAIAKIGK
jgi:type II secretory pathway predicted ATPase ExeA